MNLNQVKKLMDRKKTARKGENGHALIIGGSENEVGSVVLAGLAALRAGCDLTTVATTEKIAWVINRYSPDLLSTKIKSFWTVKLAKDMVKQAEKYGAILSAVVSPAKRISSVIILFEDHPAQK